MILPIKQTDVYGGLAEITGLLRKQESMLVLEYQVRDDVFGMFNSNIRTLELPFSQIESIEVKKRWFSVKFEIYLNRLPAIKKPLHLKENCLSFDINRKDLEKARNLCSNLLIIISEKKLADMDSEFHLDSDHQAPDYNRKTASHNPFKSGDEGFKNILRDEYVLSPGLIYSFIISVSSDVCV